MESRIIEKLQKTLLVDITKKRKRKKRNKKEREICLNSKT